MGLNLDSFCYSFVILSLFGGFKQKFINLFIYSWYFSLGGNAPERLHLVTILASLGTVVSRRTLSCLIVLFTLYLELLVLSVYV